MKNLNWYILLFASVLFCEISFGLSKREKIMYIEELASTFQRDKVFYRWQSETSRHNMLSAGYWTKDLYSYFMGMPRDDQKLRAGQGIYVSEDIASSSAYGDVPMQIIVEAGSKYINLRNSSIRGKLRRLGVRSRDVYHLNPRVSVKYHLPDFMQHDDHWWVLKTHEGVTFQPIPVGDMSVEELRRLFQPIFRRKSYRNIGRQAAIMKIINGILNIAPSSKDKMKVLRALRLPGQSLDASLAQLDLSPKNISKIKHNVFKIRSTQHALELLQSGHSVVPRTEIIQFLISNIRSPKFTSSLLSSGVRFSLPIRRRMIKASIPYIRSGTDGGLLLRHIRENKIYMRLVYLKRILKKAIPLIQSAADGAALLREVRVSDYIKYSYVRRIVRAVQPLIQSVSDAAQLLSIEQPALSRSDRRKIAHAGMFYIHSVEDGIVLLNSIKRSSFHRNRLRKQVLEKTIDTTHTIAEFGKLINGIKETAGASELQKVISASLFFIESTEDGVLILNAMRKKKDPLPYKNVKRVLAVVTPYFKTTEDGAMLLGVEGPVISQRDKRKIANQMISLIQSSADGYDALEAVRGAFMFNILRGQRVVSKTLPFIPDDVQEEELKDWPLSKLEKRRVLAQTAARRPPAVPSDSSVENVENKVAQNNPVNVQCLKQNLGVSQ